ncbi:MAG TPA: manganese efflux pump MntP family protein [Sphingomonas sp.]|nr:manganese efflux pump MntP family protein [Sphingomonas sp.]
MLLLTLPALGLGLSVDAFAAAVAKGATMRRPRPAEAIRIGAVFGAAEAVMPAIGWAIGASFAGRVMAASDWIAFGLLAAVGAHMLWEAANERDAPAEAERKSGGARLILTALATSIDALAVGVSLAVLHMPILAACIVIGLVTMIVAAIGVLIGHHASAHLGARAEIMGGIVLIGIGATILGRHLWAG